MATTTLAQNGQKITVPANTTEHQIDFNNVLEGEYGEALIDWVSGTSVQLNSNGVAIDTPTAALNTTQNKMILPIKRGTNIRYKGGAGSETFNIYIHPK
jgi:hypothetical protein